VGLRDQWDGFRLITEKRGHAVKLWSRNGIDVTTRYAMLLPALQKIDGSCVIDGELHALDAHGRSRFQLLQSALNKKAKLLYVVFDAAAGNGGRASFTLAIPPRAIAPKQKLCEQASLFLVADVVDANIDARTILHRFIAGYVERCPCRKLNPDVLVVQSAQNWHGQYATE
jgi:hypothetical protein